jgi:hypothetical protein
MTADDLTRLYGAYANRTRGARARRGPGAALAAPDSETSARCQQARQDHQDKQPEESLRASRGALSVLMPGSSSC